MPDIYQGSLKTKVFNVLYNRVCHTFSAILIAFTLISSKSFSADQEGFRHRRQRLRKQINNSRETNIRGVKGLSTVLFYEDKGRFRFSATACEEKRLLEQLKKHLEIENAGVLQRTIERMQEGQILIYRSYSSKQNQATFKAAFLAPPLPYHDYILNLHGIEDVFHAYNACVVLESKVEATGNVVYMQTEGSMFGVTRQINFPLLFALNKEIKSHSVVEPHQEVVIGAIEDLPPRSPDRDSIQEKFIDYCRLRPYFAEKKENGAYAVSDEEILTILDEIALNKEQECEMRFIQGEFRVHYLYEHFVLVTYFFYSEINLEKLLPDIPIVKTLGGRIIRMLADEASGKYIPLSMKNLRDFGIEVEEGKKSSPALPETRDKQSLPSYKTDDLPEKR